VLQRSFTSCGPPGIPRTASGRLRCSIPTWSSTGPAGESTRGASEIEGLVEGDDVAVVFWRETARSHQSDLKIRYDTASLFKVRAGKIVEMTGYLDRDEALRAAGL
jgi:hypothetical protein